MTKIQRQVYQIAISLVSCLLIATSTQANSFDLNETDTIKKAEQLEAIFNNIEKAQTQQQALKNYIKHFPRTKQSFNDLFADQENSPLHDGLKYILKLENYFNYQQEPTLELLLDLASELTLNSDASKYLQLTLMKVANSYSGLFCSYLKNYSEADQNAIITFMASGKNGPGVGYEQLMTILYQTKQHAIANKLNQALKVKNY
jgi:hypothetical protein